MPHPHWGLKGASDAPSEAMIEKISTLRIMASLEMIATLEKAGLLEEVRIEDGVNTVWSVETWECMNGVPALLTVQQC